MACGKLQALLIRKTRARSARDLAAARRALREHVQKCSACAKRVKR